MATQLCTGRKEGNYLVDCSFVVIIATSIEFIVFLIASLVISSACKINTFTHICATVASFPSFTSVAFDVLPQILNLVIAIWAGMSYQS